MRYLAILSAVGGITAILMALLAVTAHTYFFRITGAGFLRGAVALLLLSLVIMVYDKIYCRR